MPTPANTVLQLKIVLEGIDPPIWRRIQIPSSANFWDLHVAIQNAMGWKDCHLHVFRVQTRGGDTLIGVLDDDPFNGSEPFLDGQEETLSSFLSKVGDSIEYDYDLGDDWNHSVVVEKIGPADAQLRYPLCLDGARACPPEDCGGALGYRELVDILANPEHEQYAELLDWLGGVYAPDKFSAQDVQFENPTASWESSYSRELPESPSSRLEKLLSGTSRPIGAMGFPKAHGFIFAVACAPELVQPSEWLPQIFGGQQLSFDPEDEGNVIIGQLMLLYNDLNQGVDSALARQICFHDDVMVNFDKSAPIRQWCDGFTDGHLWLFDAWKKRTSARELSAVNELFFNLGFFANRRLGHKIIERVADDDLDLETLACMMRRSFLSAADKYRKLGSDLYRRHLEQQPSRGRKRRTGRNDLCPCGSGKKFKKCCSGQGPTV